jgi:multidrug transporter EmrE-like cation transporter
MNAWTGFLYVALTVLFTVYGQLVLKWQVNLAGGMPENADGKILFLLRMLLNPWIISGFAAAFLASMAWMAAMTKFQLSFAYPFMSLNFVLVLVLSAWLFHEPLTVLKVVGLGFIIVGIVISSHG